MQYPKTNMIVLIARLFQAALGFGAMGFAIALCTPWYLDTAYTIPPAFCGGFIGVEALLGLLAARKDDFDWVLVLTMDLFSMSCAIGAIVALALMIRVPWWEWDDGEGPSAVLAYAPLAFAAISMLMLLPSMHRSLELWRQGRRPQLQTAKDNISQYESYPYAGEIYNPPPQNQYIVEQVQATPNQHFDIKSPASPRPLSAAETTACWSDVSGDATLNRSSAVFSEKSPPSYVSPLPSRTPTTIHRKPVN